MEKEARKQNASCTTSKAKVMQACQKGKKEQELKKGRSS
jgi:hypothetical protein